MKREYIFLCQGQGCSAKLRMFALEKGHGKSYELTCPKCAEVLPVTLPVYASRTKRIGDFSDAFAGLAGHFSKNPK